MNTLDELPDWDAVLRTMPRRGGRPKLPKLPGVKEAKPDDPTLAFLLKHKLRTLQYVRVLVCLANARGPLSRAKIAERTGNKTTAWIGRSIGYADPNKRAKFEQTKDGGGKPGKPCPSLLTLGLVVEDEFDIDGLKELVISLTPAGRAVAKEWIASGLELPKVAIVDRPKKK